MRNRTPRFTITYPSTEWIMVLVCTLFLIMTPQAEAETTKLSDLPADHDLSPQEQERAIRESLKIQQELGGPLDLKYNLLQSIRNQQHLLAPTNHAPAVPAPPSVHSHGYPYGHHHLRFHPLTNHAKSQMSPVELLRNTASGLDRAANRLEKSNLYAQADGLRDLAQKLRLDARELQGPKSTTKKSP